MKQIIYRILIGVAVLVLLITGLIVYKLYFSSSKTMVACTEEAKLCPDGSSVGRSGPNCDFDPCPNAPSPHEACIIKQGYAWCEYNSKCYQTGTYSCPPEIKPDFDQSGLVTKLGETVQGEGLVLKYQEADQEVNKKLIFTADSWCGDKDDLIACLALSVSDYGLTTKQVRILGLLDGDSVKVLRAIAETETGIATSSAASLANPASLNCSTWGGRSVIETRGDGSQYGLCYFDDNRACEEWAMMRGDCPVGGVKTTGYDTIDQKFCAWSGGKTIAEENSVCTFADESTCLTKDYYDGKCQPGANPKKLK